MQVNKTYIENLLVINGNRFNDPRGFFKELYNKPAFLEHGIDETFNQDNFSYSESNVLRGLHYQEAPYAQAKLVQVLKGKVFDVAVDLRPNSATFKKWFSIELSESDDLSIFIPTVLRMDF